MLGNALKGNDTELNYLTIIPEEDGCMLAIAPYEILLDVWQAATYQGSTDGGVTWTEIIPYTEIWVPLGERLMLRGNMFNIYQMGCDYGLDKVSFLYANIVTLSGIYSVEGTPLSLLHGDNFRTKKDLFPNCFQTLFGDTNYYNPSGLLRINNPDTFLPSTVLSKRCYAGMLGACEWLVNAPKLPATELAYGCYDQMFYGCSSLLEAPSLPAEALVDECYNLMFYACSRLNYIEAMFLSEPSVIYTQGWVYGVASQGTFVKNKNATWNVTGDIGVPEGWTVQTK